MWLCFYYHIRALERTCYKSQNHRTNYFHFNNEYHQGSGKIPILHLKQEKISYPHYQVSE